MRRAGRIVGLVGMYALQVGALAVLVYVVVVGMLALTRAYGQTPIPTSTPLASCGVTACDQDATGQLSCPRGFVAANQNECESANSYVLRDNRGGFDCPDSSYPDVDPEYLVICDADPGDDVRWVFRRADLEWEVELEHIPSIAVLDADGEPATEDPSSAIQSDGSIFVTEGETETTAEIGVDAGFTINYSDAQLSGMGALTVLSPPTQLQFYADAWDVDTATYVRPGRHALHAAAEEAAIIQLAPCERIRAVSIQSLDVSGEEPNNLTSNDQVRLSVSVDTIDSATLCTVTGTANSATCLGPLPEVSVPAGSTISVRLDCFNGEDPCASAQISVLAQLYCY